MTEYKMTDADRCALAELLEITKASRQGNADTILIGQSIHDELRRYLPTQHVPELTELHEEVDKRIRASLGDSGGEIPASLSEWSQPAQPIGSLSDIVDECRAAAKREAAAMDAITGARRASEPPVLNARKGQEGQAAVSLPRAKGRK
jgi:hypothetical protein